MASNHTHCTTKFHAIPQACSSNYTRTLVAETKCLPPRSHSELAHGGCRHVYKQPTTARHKQASNHSNRTVKSNKKTAVQISIVKESIKLTGVTCSNTVHAQRRSRQHVSHRLQKFEIDEARLQERSIQSSYGFEWIRRNLHCALQ